MQNDNVKVMALRRDGECVCGAFVPRGSQAGWHRSLHVVLCATCLQLDVPPEPVDVGVPGASLEREYARRTAARELRVRQRHPRIGGLLLKLRGPERTTQAFAIGAAGEREIASKLQRELGDAVLFLFNRRLGTGRVRGDIDIIAIAATGVWVIDPKNYAGKKVRARRDTFVVNGRRHPQLAESMRRQLDVVRTGVASGPAPTVPVQGGYCFLDADLPWTRLVVEGVPALSPRATIRALREPGPVDAAKRARLHADLARRFPPA